MPNSIQAGIKAAIALLGPRIPQRNGQPIPAGSSGLSAQALINLLKPRIPKPINPKSITAAQALTTDNQFGTTLSPDLSTAALTGFNSAPPAFPQGTPASTPIATAATTVPVTPDTVLPPEPSAPATVAPIDIASILKTMQTISANSTNPMTQVQNFLNSRGNSASNILGVADPSSLRTLTPQQILGLAGARADNEYKRLLSAAQAIKLRGQVTGQTQADALQRAILPNLISSAGTTARTEFTQQQTNKRAAGKGSTQAEVNAKILSKVSNGEALTAGEKRIADSILNKSGGSISPLVSLRSSLLEAQKLRKLYVSSGVDAGLIDSIAPPIDTNLLDRLDTLIREKLGVNVTANAPTAKAPATGKPRFELLP